MDNLIFLIGPLVCMVGMGLMMLLMGKGMGMGRKGQDDTDAKLTAEPRTEKHK